MPKQFVRQVDDLSITTANGTVPVITAAFHLAAAQLVNIWFVAPDARLAGSGGGSVQTTISLSLTLEKPFAASENAQRPASSHWTGNVGTLSLAFAKDTLNLAAGSYLVVAHLGINTSDQLHLPHVFLMVSGTA